MFIITAFVSAFLCIMGAIACFLIGYLIDSSRRERINRLRHYPMFPDLCDSPYSDPYYQEQRLIALQRDNYTCQFCGSPANITHHVVPLREGGSHDAENLVCVCPQCHPVVEWG